LSCGDERSEWIQENASISNSSIKMPSPET
jgi:hypothetical protein